MSVATKARELLADLHDLATRCPHCNGELAHATSRWVRLDSFDPMHGRSEVTYAEGKGFIERDFADPICVRLTARGLEHMSRKARSDSDFARQPAE